MIQRKNMKNSVCLQLSQLIEGRYTKAIKTSKISQYPGRKKNNKRNYLDSIIIDRINANRMPSRSRTRLSPQIVASVVSEHSYCHAKQRIHAFDKSVLSMATITANPHSRNELTILLSRYVRSRERKGEK